MQEGVVNQGRDESTTPAALLIKFAGFLVDANSENSQVILTSFMIALEINSLHDLWVVDSGATDHMSNKLTNIHDFCPISSSVSVANGKGVLIKGKEKIKLVSNTIEFDGLYVLSFPFQLPYAQKMASSLNCEVLFTPYKVVFQDPVNKKTIGEGFHLNGLYFFSFDFRTPKGFQATSSPINEHLLWHHRLAHPSEFIFSKINLG